MSLPKGETEKLKEVKNGKKKKDNTKRQKDIPSECPRGDGKMEEGASLGKKGREGPSYTRLGVRGEISAYQKEDL